MIAADVEREVIDYCAAAIRHGEPGPIETARRFQQLLALYRYERARADRASEDACSCSGRCWYADDGPEKSALAECVRLGVEP